MASSPRAELDAISSRKRKRNDDGRHRMSPETSPWLFTKEEVTDTPSRHDGVPADTERLVAARGARFIMDIGTRIGVPSLTISVACTFFHRFFMLESVMRHKPPLVAAAAFFLACKVQETHKRLREVIMCAVKLRTTGTKDYPDGIDISEDAPAFYDEKMHILDMEREMLRVLNFDLTVEHPYRAVWLLARAYLPNDDNGTHKAVVQAAWNFLNDSYETYVCVQYDPHEIAAAAFFLAATLHDFPLPNGKKRNEHGERIKGWHEMYDVDIHNVEAICRSMMNVYELKSQNAKKIVNGAHPVDHVQGKTDVDPDTPSPKKLKTSPMDG